MKLPLPLVMGYGITAIPLAILGLPLYIYLPTFYAETVGLSMTSIGIILFVARFLDMFSDPLIGWFSDKNATSFGRRKPYMVAGALLLLVSFYALIHPWNAYPQSWLLILSIVVYLAWSLITIPYLAWSAEISTHYHDKTRLSASRELFTIVGALLALALPFALQASADAGASLSLLYALFVITLFPTLTLTLTSVPDTPQQHPKSHAIIPTLSHLWKRVPQLKRLQMSFTLNALANALPATLFLLYVELVLQRPDLTGALLLLYFISGVLGLPIWTLLAKHYGKHPSWLGSILMASFVFAFVPYLGPGDHMAFALICLITGLCLGADMALPTSIQADISQQIQGEGEQYSGILFGIWAMLTKLALALAVGVGFVTLGLAGFDPNLPTPASLHTLTLLYGGLPVLLKITCYLLMRHYQEFPPHHNKG